MTSSCKGADSTTASAATAFPESVGAGDAAVSSTAPLASPGNSSMLCIGVGSGDAGLAIGVDNGSAAICVCNGCGAGIRTGVLGSGFAAFSGGAKSTAGFGFDGT